MDMLVSVVSSGYTQKVLGGGRMGTTVTTNLGLIKPDTDESIKVDGPMVGWAAQNTINMDKVDALFRDDVVTSYVVSWTGSGGNPVLGAGGFTEGKYIRFFPRMVAVFFRIFTGGAGFTVGSGQYRINLPLAVDPSFAAISHTVPIGKATWNDASAVVSSSAFSCIYSPGSALLFFRPSAGGTWTDVLPVVPAQNDRLAGYVIYPTAVA